MATTRENGAGGDPAGDGAARPGAPRGTRRGRETAPRTTLALNVRFSGRSHTGNAEHGVILGASQCGKTYAARTLLRPLRNLVIVDTKRAGEFDMFGPPTEDPDDILRRGVVVFQPPRSAVERAAKDWSDPWSRALWNIQQVRRSCTLYVDELRRACPTHPHPLLADLVTQGMGQGIGFWGTAQGPSGIYPPAMHDAVHVFLFRLHSASMRGTLASNLEVEVGERLGQLRPREFLYWRQGMLEVSGPHTAADITGDGAVPAPAPPPPTEPGQEGPAESGEGAKPPEMGTRTPEMETAQPAPGGSFTA